MSRALPKAFLEQLRSKVSISSVVSQWVTWDERKSNSEKGDFWGSCPFHTESAASFHVDERKGYYYCFGCHAKGDAVTFLKEKLNVSFLDAIAVICARNGIALPIGRNVLSSSPFPSLIELKDFVVSNFSAENFFEVGIICGKEQLIQRHPRLLRSLNFGDPDYSASVLDVLSKIAAANDESIEKIEAYISRKFLPEIDKLEQFANFRSTEAGIGYKFQPPRNDIVAVMMPFAAGFTAVYETIRNSCTDAGLVCKRADEVWNSSILINDILDLINHAKVVVCDLTGRNENVFYELGVAHAWGKPVIPITQTSADVPFDLRHHRYLTYLNNKEGLVDLSGRITPRLLSLTGKP